MKIILSLVSLLILTAACDYRKYPQEEEWKEEVREIGDEKEN
jgi:hypothetical protein